MWRPRRPVQWETLPLAEARKQGAMMLFGEKYPDPVRMVSMGVAGHEFRELCGGTHLTNTGEVGAFEIVSEEGVSAGTRRIVALTGGRAKEQAAETSRALELAATALGCGADQVPAAVAALVAEQRALKKQLSSGQPAATDQARPCRPPPESSTTSRRSSPWPRRRGNCPSPPSRRSNESTRC